MISFEQTRIIFVTHYKPLRLIAFTIIFKRVHNIFRLRNVREMPMNRGPSATPSGAPINLSEESFADLPTNRGSYLLTLSNDKNISLRFVLPNGRRTQALLLTEQNRSGVSLLVDAPACQSEQVLEQLLGTNSEQHPASTDAALQSGSLENLAKSVTLRSSTTRDDREELKKLLFFSDSNNDEIVRIHFPEGFGSKVVEQILENAVQSEILIAETQQNPETAYSYRQEQLEVELAETNEIFKDATSKRREEDIRRTLRRDAEKMDALIREVAECLLQTAPPPSYLNRDDFEQERTIFESLKQQILTSSSLDERPIATEHNSSGPIDSAPPREAIPNATQAQKNPSKTFILVWDDESVSSVKTRSLSLNGTEVSFSHERIRPAIVALACYFDHNSSISLTQKTWGSKPLAESNNESPLALRELQSGTVRRVQETDSDAEAMPDQKIPNQEGEHLSLRQPTSDPSSRAKDLYTELSIQYDDVIIVSSIPDDYFQVGDFQVGDFRNADSQTSMPGKIGRDTGLVQYVPNPDKLFDQLGAQVSQLALTDDKDFLF